MTEIEILRKLVDGVAKEIQKKNGHRGHRLQLLEIV